MDWTTVAAPDSTNAGRRPGLAAHAVEAARNVFDVELDYSPDSLRHVDAILDEFREPGSDAIAESVFVLGCYIGEVMVRNAGYEWVDTPEHLTQFLGALTVWNRTSDSHASPIGKAFKRVDHGEGDSVVYFYDSLARRSE